MSLPRPLSLVTPKQVETGASEAKLDTGAYHFLSSRMVPKELSKIARRFNACRYPHLFHLALVFLIREE